MNDKENQKKLVRAITADMHNKYDKSFSILIENNVQIGKKILEKLTDLRNVNSILRVSNTNNTSDKLRYIQNLSGVLSAILTYNVLLNKQSNTNNNLEPDANIIRKYYSEGGSLFISMMDTYCKDNCTLCLSYKNLNVLFNYCLNQAKYYKVDLLYFSLYNFNKYIKDDKSTK